MFACEICDRQFFYKNSVNRHFRREHINKESRKRLKCTECDHECRFYNDLRTHIYVEHEIVCKVERRMFADIEEFKDWKRKFEETSHFMYVKHSSSKISVSSNERKTYFVCHRTGTFQSGSCGKRKLKRQGSNKINASCPSTMEVVESLTDGTVKLVLWKTHAGHNAEISRTFLSAGERNWLAARISEGASYQKIMNEIQKLGNESGRMRFIKSQDVRNMKKNLINSRNRVILSDLRCWVRSVQNMEHLNYSPVVYFKDRNSSDPKRMLSVKEVMLVVMTEFQEKALRNSEHKFICLDATHCQENYEYQLITLYIADKSLWCPVVYCVTSVVNVSSIRCFLQAVKERVGLIHCPVFISDDDPPFYDAWCEVMWKPQHYFIHLWYLEKNWKENLLKIKCTDKAKTTIFTTLKTLLNETDERSFEKKLYSFLNSLLYDSRLAEFASYFQHEFAGKTKSWANCFRKKTGLTIESQKELEKFHNKLYDEYHQGVNSQRIKDCLNSLILISRNCETISVLISNLQQCESLTILRRIRNSHKRGVLIKRSAVAEISSTSYKISVEKAKTEVNLVHWLNVGKCECSSRCLSCDICVHEISCTCVDYAVNFNICEHVHACAILRKNINIDLSSETDEPLDNFVEEVICEEEIVCNLDPSADGESAEDVVSDDDEELIFIENSEFAMRSECSSDNEDSNDVSEPREVACDLGNNLDINFERGTTLYYEPFAFVDSAGIQDFGPTELKLEEGLQIVAFENEDKFDGALVNDDDSSSFGDASSVYEDTIPHKGAIIALGFSGDSSDNYIFRRFDDNTIIRHKIDTLFTLGDFENLGNGDIPLSINAQIGSLENEDFQRCYGTYGPSEEDSIVLTL